MVIASHVYAEGGRRWRVVVKSTLVSQTAYMRGLPSLVLDAPENEAAHQQRDSTSYLHPW